MKKWIRGRANLILSIQIELTLFFLFGTGPVVPLHRAHADYLKSPLKVFVPRVRMQPVLLQVRFPFHLLTVEGICSHRSSC